MKLYKLSWVLAAGVALAACDDPLQTDPQSAIPSEEALQNAAQLRTGVTGMYDAMQDAGGYSRDLLAYPDLFAGDISNAANLTWTGTFDTDAEVGNGDVRPTNVAVEAIWATAYRAIGRANNVLASLPTASDVESADSAQFAGEAHFIRALNYHNLVRFFGGVPLVVQPTRVLPADLAQAKSTQEQVYALIEADLTAAARLLGEGSGAGVGRPDQCSALALAARVYLDQRKDAQARDAAAAVIGDCGRELVEGYANVWRIKNSNESLFELQYTIQDSNNLAFWFFSRSLGGRRGFAPTANLYSSYAAADERRDFNIRFDSRGRRFGGKYFRIESNDDNVPVLRLAEMYMIRAEANWRLGAPAATVLADINAVRARAEVTPLGATVDTSDELRDAILHERRLEFAFEGMRFFDLRRILGVEGAAAAYDVEPSKMLWPIPQQEIETNSALRQNPGY